MVEPKDQVNVKSAVAEIRSPLVQRSMVEDFLFQEADLLDEWRLDEWLDLFLPGATYQIPSTDRPDGVPETSLFLVADDWGRLQARVKRLQSKNAHVENPRSRTRRLITNVRVAPSDEPNSVFVRATFVVYRWRYEVMDHYVGRYEHVLELRDSGLCFRRRKAILDLESLRPSGKVSLIL
jgi:p-cumate 2,3-dioxygenase subunit beta